MSIAQRVDDAEFLWENGRFEGAFLSALVAFAATSRRLYPKKEKGKENGWLDSEAFKLLFKEQFGERWNLQFGGDTVSLDVLFYKWLRCELVHEGGLPAGLKIDPDDAASLFTLTLVEGLPLSVPATWYHSLIINVIGHPVNADQFTPQAETLRAAIGKRELAGQRLLGPYVKRRSYEP